MSIVDRLRRDGDHAAADKIDRMREENAQLRAEIDRLRGTVDGKKTEAGDGEEIQEPHAKAIWQGHSQSGGASSGHWTEKVWGEEVRKAGRKRAKT